MLAPMAGECDVDAIQLPVRRNVHSGDSYQQMGTMLSVLSDCLRSFLTLVI